jgi:hypothetical protein
LQYSLIKTLLDMKFLSFSLKLSSLLLFASLLFTSCKDDVVTPATATISGTITILDSANLWATYKDSGVVELTIFPDFTLSPPAGWGAIPVDFLYPGFPGGTFALGAPSNAQMPIILTYAPGAHQFTYSLEVDPGTYSALALGFRHNLISDPSKKSATLGVFWNNPTVVSHGIVIKADVGGGNIVTFFDDPAPSSISVAKGDKLQINFTADFGFVKAWPFR